MNLPSLTAPVRAAAATPTAVHAVEVDDIVKRYSGAPALDAVTVACPAERVTVVVGPSGCGKTTLLRCIAGLEEPDAGEITIAGRAVTRVEAGRRGVAMVFQNYALYPAKTVAENIAFPLRMARIGRAERRARVTATAELLHIGALLDRRPRELSGGQRQRVGIARALVRNPSVLLMDEPLSNLDAALRSEMRTELRALQRRVGTSAVYVTHDQVEALTMADHLVVLRAGHLEQSGAPESVFAAPATTFVAGFLGAMNLLPGRVAGRVLHWGGSLVDLPPGLPTQEGQHVTIGVRPEELTVGPARPDQLGLRGTSTLVELLGTERLVHLDAGNGTIRARVPADTPLGNHLELHAERTHVHVFDSDGRRLP